MRNWDLPNVLIILGVTLVVFNFFMQEGKYIYCKLLFHFKSLSHVQPAKSMWVENKVQINQMLKYFNVIHTLKYRWHSCYMYKYSKFNFFFNAFIKSTLASANPQHTGNFVLNI